MPYYNIIHEAPVATGSFYLVECPDCHYEWETERPQEECPRCADRDPGTLGRKERANERER